MGRVRLAELVGRVRQEPYLPYQPDLPYPAHPKQC
jgi:hypothetical protein